MNGTGSLVPSAHDSGVGSSIDETTHINEELPSLGIIPDLTTMQSQEEVGSHKNLEYSQTGWLDDTVINTMDNWEMNI